MKKKKPRKPKPLRLPGYSYDSAIVLIPSGPKHGAYFDLASSYPHDATECRKIAAWCLKFAEWAEAQEGG